LQRGRPAAESVVAASESVPLLRVRVMEAEAAQEEVVAEPQVPEAAVAELVKVRPEAAKAVAAWLVEMA